MQFRGWCFAVLCVLALNAAAQTKPLRIGAENDWAPFSSAENGQPVGMAVDIVRAIFAQADIPIQLVALPYARCMLETKAGKLAGCFDTLPDAQLQRDYLFHAKPLFSDPMLILTRTESKVSAAKVQDLQGKRVLITHGYSYGDEFENNFLIQRVESSSDLSNLRMLVAGRADYSIVYRRILDHQLRGNAKDIASQIKPVGQLSNAQLYLSFSRSYPGLPAVVERFNEAHNRLLRDGTITAIAKKWD
jgi:polar amino acid transport system substrate-binding protein